MNNIWGFLIQTIEVSAVAVLLLLVKKLLEENQTFDEDIYGIDMKRGESK